DFGARPPDGSFAQPIALTPPGTGSFLIGGGIRGFRTVDLPAPQESQVGDVLQTARVNVLNVFDFENYTTFNIVSVGSDGVLDPQLEVNPFGDILYVPRTMSFEVSMRF